MVTMNPLQVSILLPGRFGGLDLASRYGRVMQNCPSCSSQLVLLMEKFGEVGQKVDPLSNSPQRSVKANTGAGEPQAMVTGGWYCSQCGIHIMPGEDVHLVKAVDKLLHPQEEAKGSPEKVKSELSQQWSFGTKLGSGADVPSQRNDGSKSDCEALHMDEEYVSWERQMQSNFTEFLQHIRQHLLAKESQLQEYQIDLCQREKALQMNEVSVQVPQERQEQLATSERALSLSKAQWSKYKEETLSQIETQMKELQQRYGSTNQNVDVKSATPISDQQTSSMPSKATSIDRDSGTFSASPSPLKLTTPKKFPPPENVYSSGTFFSPSSDPRLEPVRDGTSWQGSKAEFEKQKSDGKEENASFDRSAPSRKAFHNSSPKSPPAEGGPPSSGDSRKYTSPDRYYKGENGYGRYDPYSTRSPGGDRLRACSPDGAEHLESSTSKTRADAPDGAEGLKGHLEGSSTRGYQHSLSGSPESGYTVGSGARVEGVAEQSDNPIVAEKAHSGIAVTDTNTARPECDGQSLYRVEGMEDLPQGERQRPQRDKQVQPQSGGSSAKADYTVGMVRPPHMKHFASYDNILNEGMAGQPLERHSKQMERSRSSELIPNGKMQPLQQQQLRQQPIEMRQKRPVLVDRKPLAPVRDSQFSALGDNDVFTPGPIRYNQTNAIQGINESSTSHNKIDASDKMTERPISPDRRDLLRSTVKSQVNEVTGGPARYDLAGEKPVRHNQLDAGHRMTGKQTRDDQVDTNPMRYDQGNSRPMRHDQADGRPMRYDQGDGRSTRYDQGDGRPMRYDKGDGRSTRYDQGNGKSMRYKQGDGGPTRYGQADSAQKMTGIPPRYELVGATHGMTGRPIRYEQVDGTHGMTGRPAQYEQVDATQGMTGRPTRYEQVDGTHGMTGRPTRYEQVDGTHGMTGRPARYEQVDATQGMTGRPMRYEQVDATHGMTGRQRSYEQVDTTHGLTERQTKYEQGDRQPMRSERVNGTHGMTGRPKGYQEPAGKDMKYEKVKNYNGMSGRQSHIDEVNGRLLQYDQRDGKPTRYDQVDVTHGVSGKPVRHDHMDRKSMKHNQVDTTYGMPGKPTRQDLVASTRGRTGRPQMHEGRAPTYELSDRTDHQWESYNAGHLMTVGSIPPEDGLHAKQKVAQQLQEQQWTQGSSGKNSDNGSPIRTSSPTKTSPSRSLRDRLQLQDKSQWALAQRREQKHPQKTGGAIIKPDPLVIHRDEQQREMRRNQGAASQSARERLSQAGQAAAMKRHSMQESDRGSSLQRSSSRLTDVSDSSSQFFEFSPTYRNWIERYGSLESKADHQPKKKESLPSPKTPSTPRPHHKLPNYNTYVRALTHDYNDYKSSLPAVPLSPTGKEAPEVSSA